MTDPVVPANPAFNSVYHIPFGRNVNLTARATLGIGYRELELEDMCPKCGKKAEYQDFAVDIKLERFPAGYGRKRAVLYNCNACQEGYIVIEEPQ